MNDLLVQLGREGRNAVRLKGGDPFVFGRGGEEPLALLVADLPFEVVPGVSSVVAAPTAAGIPVTQVGGTLVVLMAVAQRTSIAADLMRGGLSPDTPVAAISDATGMAQQVVRCTLGSLSEVEVLSPAIIVIGAVAGLDVVGAEFAGLAAGRFS